MKKIIFFASLTVLVVLFFSIATLTYFPNILINNQTAKYIADKKFPKLKVDWNSVSLKAQSDSLTATSFSLDIKDGCILYSLHKICLKKLSIKLKIPIFNWKAFNLKELHLEDSEISIVLPENNKASPQTSKDHGHIIQAFHTYKKKWEKVKPSVFLVKLNNTSIQHGNATYKIESTINKKIQFKLSNSDVNITGLIDKTTDKNTFKGNIIFDNKELSLSSDLQVSINKKIKAKVDTLIKRKIKSQIDDYLVEPTLKLTSHLDYEGEVISLSLDPILLKLKKHLTSFSAKDCNLRIDLGEDQSPAKATCENLSLELNSRSLLKSQSEFKNFPNQKLNVQMNFLANFLLEPKNIQERHQWGNISFFGKNNDQKRFVIDFKFISDIYRYNNDLSLDPKKFDLTLKIESFNYLVGLLKNTPFSIPAPLNSLEGSLALASKNFSAYQRPYKKLPFDIEVNLDSSKQNQLNGSAQVELFLSSNQKQKSKIKISALLNKLHLYLPKIDPIKGIPNISSPNIQKNFSKSQSKKNQNFDIELSLKSQSDKSVRIYYYLFDPYLDFGVNSSYGKNTGFSIYKKKSDASLKYLKRTLYVNNIKVENKSGSEETFINSSFLYKEAGYVITLNIVGTAGEPELILTSQPNLPREDIISLLIYNRKTNEISSFNKESVGGAKAAIADRTLGLFSIWAFASTPIETISYDPGRKTYSAQVALPGDIKFTIGTDWDTVNSLSFHKRLGNSWLLVTSYEPEEIGQDKGNFLLQKEYNY